MRIAQVSDFYLPRLGGIEMHVSDLAARQRDAGHHVDVLTSTPGPAAAAEPPPERPSGHAAEPPPEQAPGHAAEPAPGQVIRLTDRYRRPHALHPLATAAGIGVLLEGRYDVVHAHLGVASPLAFFLARAAARRGIPTVVTVHSMWAGVHPVMAAMDAWGGWSRLPIVWTAVSDAAAAPVRRVLGDSIPVHVVPNGIEQEQWRVPPAPREPHELVVVAVMRIARRKRPLALLDILASAQDRLGSDVRLRLVVVGDGPGMAGFRTAVAQHRAHPSVTLLGRLERAQVREVLGAGHVFVAPANLESFGIAALEARCAGLPVVAKASGGVREFIRHGREGLLCDTDADMASALTGLALDEPRRAAIAAHNRSSTCAVSWTTVLRRTESAYEVARAAQQAPLPRSRAGAVAAELPGGTADRIDRVGARTTEAASARRRGGAATWARAEASLDRSSTG